MSHLYSQQLVDLPNFLDEIMKYFHVLSQRTTRYYALKLSQLWLCYFEQ